MKAQLRVLSGSPAGSVHVFSKSSVILGRHPRCDVQFDPEADLDVSARHAAVTREGERWTVRDLGSSNGTLVNGHRITAETRLDDTDQIRLGPKGPLIEFRLVSEGTADTIKPRVAAAAAAPPRATGASAAPPSGGRAPAQSTSHRVRVEVARQTRRLRRGLGVLVVALAGVIAGALFFTLRQTAEREVEVAQLQSQIDSVLDTSERTIRDLQGRVVGLAEALERSRTQMQDLQGQLDDARAAGNAQQIAVLSRRLTEAMAELNERQNAATIDYGAIRQANQRAVAMVWVEFGPGDIVTGTAFAVRPDALMLTNRHVVAGPDGRQQPRRIAIQFADSEQAFPARVVAVSQDEAIDLALVQVDNIAGDVPTVLGLNARVDTVQAGSPVAIIGFPLGTELGMRQGATGRVASTSLTAGIVSKLLPDRLEVHGFGAEGLSGSPIFDAAGRVIGVVFGGSGGGSADRIIIAVPASHAMAMVQSLRGVSAQR